MINFSQNNAKYTLNSLQKGMLFYSINHPDSTTYINQVIFKLPESINKENMEKTIKTLIEYHDILKAGINFETFEIEIPVDNQYSFEFIDLSISSNEPQIRFQKILKEQREKKIDNVNSPLIWFCLIKFQDRHFEFIVTYHHLLLGGTAAITIARDIFDIYDEISGKSVLQPPVKSYYKDHHHLLINEESEQAKTYWKELVNGYKDCVKLSEYGIELKAQEIIRCHDFKISKSITSALTQFCKKEKITPNIVLQMALILVLAKYNSIEDLVIGVVHELKKARKGKLIGLQINTLPVRLKIDSNDTVKNHLLQIRMQHKRISEFGSFPLDMIQKFTKLPHNTPLFDVLFNFMPFSPEYQFHRNNPNCENRSMEYVSDTQYPLVCDIQGELDQFKGIFSYKDNYYDANFVESISKKFLYFLSEILRLYSKPLDEISLTTPEEKRLILNAWQGRNQNHFLGWTVDRLVDEQVEKSPNAIAVTDFSDNSLTYLELQTQASTLAQSLQPLLADKITVAIYMESCIERIVAIYGIMKAGATYLPIEIGTPQKRIKFILEDSQTLIVVTQAKCFDYLKESTQGLDIQLISIDEIVKNLLNYNYKSNHGADTPIYVMYTSGTTGNPKGVINVHQGLVNQLLWMKHNFSLNDSDITLHRTSIAFDASFSEIFSSLICGSKLIILPDKWRIDVYQIINLINKHHITHIHLVPSFLKLFLQAPGVETCQSLKHVFCIGEILTCTLKDLFFKVLPNSNLHNLYGPTEASVNVTSHTCQQRENVVSIGSPIDNMQVYVLNENLQLMPPYVRGELHISGVGLAKGYVNNKFLTTERFIKNPYSSLPNNFLYKTGDYGYWLPDGNIQYLYRRDNQVKSKGHRIELEEIECVLQMHKNIKQAAVIEKKYETSSCLLAYVVKDGSVSRRDIKVFLKKYLPNYMVPEKIAYLESLPILPSGKVDRKTLINLELKHIPSQKFLNSLEDFISKIWADVLQVCSNKIHSSINFFEIGGGSLTAVQVAIRLSHHYHCQVPIQLLFEYQTLEKYAKSLLKLIDKKHIKIKNIENTEFPLSSAQQRLWILHKLNPNDPKYNISVCLQLNGCLNLSALEFSFETLVQRHSCLNSIIKENSDGEPRQLILQHIYPFQINFIDMQSNSLNEIETFVIEYTQIPFEISKKPCFEVFVIQSSVKRYIIFIKSHHLFIDGWSLNILSREIELIYNSSTKHKYNPLKAIEINYAQYVYWQRQYLVSEEAQEKIQYWKNELHNMQGTSQLYGSNFTTDNLSSGKRIAFKIDSTITKGLINLSERTGCNPFVTTLLSFSLLMNRFLSQEEIVVATPLAGRIYPDPEIENIIGCFVNILPIKLCVDGYMDFITLSKLARQQVMNVMSNQEIPFEKIVEACGQHLSKNVQPITNIMFVYQNLEIELPYFRELKTKRIFSDNQSLLAADYESAKLDITCYFKLEEDKFCGLLEYNKNLISEEKAKFLVSSFQKLLGNIVKSPDMPVSKLGYTSSHESKIIAMTNKTYVDFPKTKSIVDLFKEQVEKTPYDIALIFSDKHITYQELDNYTNQLANYIKPRVGTSKTPIAIFLDKSLEMVYAIIAVLKIGLPYLPIFPADPINRITTILSNARCSLILTENKYQHKAHQFKSMASIILDKEVSEWTQESIHFSHLIKSQNPMYVIYTSGSTGEPKGVIMNHRALVNRLSWMQNEYQLNSDDVVLHKTTYTFDVSVWEIFWPLISGAKLLITKPDGQGDPRYLIDTIIKNKVTTIHFVPSMLSAFLNYDDIKDCSSLVRVFSSGEALSLKTQQILFSKLPWVSLYNLYGPTEAAIDVTHWKCDQQTSLSFVPIGKPIQNTKIFILDRYQQLAPIGAVGEIYIAGVGLSSGYINNPELTEKFFIHLPTGERIYKTGDLGCWLEDGNIKYLGRLDTQIKIRGFRIEIGEIESKILEYPGIESATVICVENHRNEPQLFAFFATIEANNQINPLFIMQSLGQALPAHMLPNKLIQIDAIPLLSNGKIDRNKLKQLIVNEAPKDSQYRSPITETQHRLAEIWAEFFNISVNQIGLDSNFFELGGHSLSAIKIAYQIEKIFQIQISFNDFFNANNLEKLSQIIDGELLQNSINLAGLKYIAVKESPLVILQPDGNKTPIFLFHPVGGTVFCYMDMVKYLSKDRPCYAIQDPGIQSSQALYTSIPEMAHDYLKIIRQIQPHGPYILGGGSFGGTLAVEMAAQLAKVDEETALIALFDSWALFTDEFRDRKRLEQRLKRQYQLLKARLNSSYIPNPEPLLELNWHRMNLCLNYKPPLINNELTLFKANTLFSEYLPIEDCTNYWQQYSTQTVKVFTVPGNHETIFLESNAEVLANKLINCLENLPINV